MAVRSCRVTIERTDGVSHTVEVTAATLYEAVAQGLAALRGREWVDGIPQGHNIIKVAVAEVPVVPGKSHRIHEMVRANRRFPILYAPRAFPTLLTVDWLPSSQTRPGQFFREPGIPKIARMRCRWKTSTRGGRRHFRRAGEHSKFWRRQSLNQGIRTVDSFTRPSIAPVRCRRTAIKTTLTHR
jgi:hypothetical protein